MQLASTGSQPSAWQLMLNHTNDGEGAEPLCHTSSHWQHLPRYNKGVSFSHPSYACHIGKTSALQPTTHLSLTANSQRNQKGPSSHPPIKSTTSHHTPDPAGYQTFAIRKATVLHQHHDMGSMLSRLLRLSEGQ